MRTKQNKTKTASVTPEKLRKHTCTTDRETRKQCPACQRNKRIGVLTFDEFIQTTKPHESNEDFKARLRAMIPKPPRNAEERPCVRTPADKGFYPPEREKAPTGALQAPIDDHASALVRIVELTAHAEKLAEALREYVNNPSLTTVAKAEEALMQWEFRNRTDRDSEGGE